MKKIRTLAFVMAGGEGTRLYPLTTERSKPAVPFGARYQIVDFALSNLINSNIHAIYLLVQYKSQSLIEHIRKSWVLSPMLPEQFVTVVPPQMRSGREWFQGTADAVRQNLNLIEQFQPELVAVFGADHVYRMDIRQMIRYHNERDADATVAALPIPLEQAPSFGVMVTAANGRIQDFQEKPENPAPMPSDPTLAYASMGNYLFKTQVLFDALQGGVESAASDFGHDVLPNLMKSGRLFAYDFATNKTPGVKSYEDPHYWRDVGTIESYFEANQDMLGLKPKFDVFNPRWPIYSSTYQGPVARIIDGQVKNSHLGAGSVVNNAIVHNAIIRHEVILEAGVELEDCIIMDYVRIRRGAKLRRAIVDRYNTIPVNARIGFEHNDDLEQYTVTSNGLVVVPSAKVGKAKRSYTEGYL